ncbi:hypothetical protein PCANC_17438 [Puccinia coronata f. sp. avenae]|uniref:Uncharacterized protein n=1 Tax=Puccinia coronata f. sp. avenae TaxID=200324 RepID=A0A2N5UV10_9BASI|nr:hypothetical protein PCANC_17438 [Puccinia coronata f. sp. avenae]
MQEEGVTVGSAQQQEELEAPRRSEIAATEKELEANLAEQVVVLAKAIGRFSRARSDAEDLLNKEQEAAAAAAEAAGEGGGTAAEAEGEKAPTEEKEIASFQFKKKLLLFGPEISAQFEQIMERLDHRPPPAGEHGIDDAHKAAPNDALLPLTNGALNVDNKVREELRVAKDWVNTVGLQSM